MQEEQQVMAAVRMCHGAETFWTYSASAIVASNHSNCQKDDFELQRDHGRR